MRSRSSTTIRCWTASRAGLTFTSCIRTTPIRRTPESRSARPSTGSILRPSSPLRTWSRRSSIPKKAPTWACASTPILVGLPRPAVFTPIPAIDIRGGRCVRLVEGDFARETRYADDPAEMARHWEAEGAQRLHVIDLDGARDGVRANADVIRRLLGSVQIPVQVGGGIRTLETAKEL